MISMIPSTAVSVKLAVSYRDLCLGCQPEGTQCIKHGSMYKKWVNGIKARGQGPTYDVVVAAKHCSAIFLRNQADRTFGSAAGEAKIYLGMLV